jgi:AcrR family transcriptional regulator
MKSGRRTSSSTRDARTQRTTGAARGNGSARSNGIAPLYKRLPHGPHRLERSEVVLHQRARIHGAMVEAVARSGYDETSVKQIIGLAGVSRRSFYEQFANKQECFLATFDLIVRRELASVNRAHLAVDGPLEERARAVFQALAKVAREDRGAAMLVVLESQRAGLPGALRLRRATAACEQLLACGFGELPDATPLPKPIVRAIAGGLHGATSSFLRQGPATTVDLAEELLQWTMQFQTPAAADMAERMALGLTARLREISSVYGNGLGGAETVSRDERARLLQAVLRLVTREDYRALSAPQIADEANVSVDAFCEQFDDKDDCFLAALDTIGDELLAIAADPDLVSEDWPRAVRRVLAELMGYLADHPLQTRALAQEAFFAGSAPLERTIELSRSIATLLTEGAPDVARGHLTADAVAGAIWHVIRCQVAAGRIQLLAALSDHLTYVVLAPFIGAEAAVEILIEERGASRDACAPSRVPQST